MVCLSLFQVNKSRVFKDNASHGCFFFQVDKSRVFLCQVNKSRGVSILFPCVALLSL